MPANVSLSQTPRLRSSDYISLVSETFPSLTSSSTTLEVPEMPSLKDIIICDLESPSTANPSLTVSKALEDYKAIRDYRSLVNVAKQDPGIHEIIQNEADTQNNNDVVNLQFTR